VLSSPHLTVSLAELEDRWSLDDLMDAHEALDVRMQLDMASRTPIPSA
jgi:hypothetical protein